MPAIVTLLTDFGTRDHYVGAMKGVIVSHAPQARIIDISHEVPPQCVGSGAFILEQSARYYPAGTVHLAVVDPGVGGSRRALALECSEHFFVGPDNGLFTFFLEKSGSRCFELARSDLFVPPVSSTFHGRDIFAPVAAWLANGGDVRQLGPEVLDAVTLKSALEAGQGEILHVDRFGNLITSFLNDLIEQKVVGEFEIGGVTVSSQAATFGEMPDDALCFYPGSGGYIEIAVKNGSAAARLRAGPGAPVIIRRR